MIFFNVYVPLAEKGALLTPNIIILLKIPKKRDGYAVTLLTILVSEMKIWKTGTKLDYSSW